MRSKNSRCKTGKRSYKTEIDAKIALSKIVKKDSSRRGKTENRVYSCNLCPSYHLTSKEER